MEKIAQWLLDCNAEITHPNPPLASRLGLFLVLQPLQIALLTEQREVSEAELVQESKRLLYAYLTSD
jgi:hypothetical protein